MPINLSTLRLASVGAAGGPGAGASYDAGPFSPDAARILFWSDDDALAPGDADAIPDLLLKDLATGTIERVNQASDGTRLRAFEDAVVAPGHDRMAFSSSAGGFLPGDRNRTADIFVKDLATGAVLRASTGSDGREADGPSYAPVFSADGGKLAFLSQATNLAPGANGEPALFVKDLASGALQRISTDLAGGGADGASSSPVFSPDGTRMAFISDADDLVPGTPPRAYDLYHLYTADLATGEVAWLGEADPNQTVAFTGAGEVLFRRGGDLVAAAEDGSGATRLVAAGGMAPLLLGDGTTLLFTSDAALTDGDADNAYDLHAIDLGSGAVDRIELGPEGGFAGWIGTVADAVSSDGGWLALTSDVNGAVAGDADYEADILVASLRASDADDHLLALGGEAVSGLRGADRIVGSSGADTLTGGQGDDLLTGGLGDDLLRGGEGRDRLEGGAGVDRLTGGAGRDLFIVGAGGRDVVTDFEAGVDELLLEPGGNVRTMAALAGAEAGSSTKQARGGLLVTLGEGVDAVSVLLRGISVQDMGELMLLG